MPKKTKFIISIVLLGIALYQLWRLMDTNGTNVEDVGAEVKITAQELLSGLNGGTPGVLDTIQNEQVIEITGSIKETNILNGRITILLKGNHDSPPFIICDMMAHQRRAVSQMAPNDSVKIKGVFKGYLKDAVLLDCVVTFSQTND